MRIIRSLRGLREVYIRCVQTDINGAAHHHLAELLDSSITSLLGLKVLPLTKVQIVLDISPWSQGWIIEERRRVADKFEQQLLST